MNTIPNIRIITKKNFTFCWLNPYQVLAGYTCILSQNSLKNAVLAGYTYIRSQNSIGLTIGKKCLIAYNNPFLQDHTMNIGVIGINHKMANLELRDAIARVTGRRLGPGRSLHEGHPTVLLSTCNRTEVYFSSDHLSETHSYLLNVLKGDLDLLEEEFDQKLYTYFGEDCFLHLSRVTAGLDSAIVAETEIQGQVKGAYELAASFTTLPAPLHYLFQKSLRIGKRVRSQLPLDRGMPNLEHAVDHAGRAFFGVNKEAKILFVGASEINRQVFSFLKKKGWNHISLCNRSEDKSNQMAKDHSIETLPWSRFDQWVDYDWIIFGTKAEKPLVMEKPQLSKSNLVIDLCVPRNVAPHIARTPNLSLLNIDQLNRTLKSRRSQMEHLIIQAEEIIQTMSQRHLDKFRIKNQIKIPLFQGCVGRG